ncbi:MAG TPA: lysophospholipid acyltransferase family protein [Tepidisphaeraceae bacterium]|jgi:1-acyl-sn-glycerol-3-phosphate acyltransferase|nr:lysophospholipid acyltransferase family protein [Tepidisphaeraceae bacterium]
MLYRAFRLLAGIVLRLFFRRIDVEGQRDLPAGPILIVSNHANALVDPLLPLIVLRRRITLTMKNVLGKNPLLATIAWCVGAIQFHRPQDLAKGAKPRQNIESMKRCREILAAGGAVCIFPEGISHSDLKMRPFQSGAAKIALDYVRKDGNPGKLKILPVGILYTHKDRFRSDVWLRFGHAFDVEQWMAQQPMVNAEVLTEYMRQQIEALTVAYENRREMLIVNWANDIVATEAKAPTMLRPDAPSPADSFNRIARLQAGYRQLRAEHGPEIESLTIQVRSYRRELARLGIDPAEVYLSRNPLHAGFFLIRELELIVIGFPLALFGTINHLLPYLIVRRIARRMSVDKDHWATNVIYPSFVIFPGFYLVQLAAAWLALPVSWAAVYSVALPYTGYYAILYHGRAAGAWRRASTFVYFLLHPALQTRLADQGREIFAAVQQLARHLDPAPAVALTGMERSP